MNYRVMPASEMIVRLKRQTMDMLGKAAEANLAPLNSVLMMGDELAVECLVALEISVSDVAMCIGTVGPIIRAKRIGMVLLGRDEVIDEPTILVFAVDLEHDGLDRMLKVVIAEHGEIETGGTPVGEWEPTVRALHEMAHNGVLSLPDDMGGHFGPELLGVTRAVLRSLVSCGHAVSGCIYNHEIQEIVS